MDECNGIIKVATSKVDQEIGMFFTKGHITNTVSFETDCFY